MRGDTRSRSAMRTPPGSLSASSAAPDMPRLVHIVILVAAASSLPRPTTWAAAAAATRGPCPLAAMRVAVAPDASAPELGAAAELALWAGRVAGTAPLAVVQPAALRSGEPHFAVGVGAVLAAGVVPGQLAFATLGEEGFSASSNSSARSVALSGAANATRGTLYAVYHYLHALGVRFLAVNATTVPACPAALPALRNVQWRPAFEYRAVNSWAALRDPLHAQRSHLNDGSHMSTSGAAVASPSTAAAASMHGKAPHPPGGTPYVRSTAVPPLHVTLCLVIRSCATRPAAHT